MAAQGRLKRDPHGGFRDERPSNTVLEALYRNEHGVQVLAEALAASRRGETARAVRGEVIEQDAGDVQPHRAFARDGALHYNARSTAPPATPGQRITDHLRTSLRKRAPGGRVHRPALRRDVAAGAAGDGARADPLLPAARQRATRRGGVAPASDRQASRERFAAEGAPGGTAGWRCKEVRYRDLVPGSPRRRRGRDHTGASRNGETRTRTGDTTIFSRVLYQLSYLAAATKGSAERAPGVSPRSAPRCR